MNVTNILLNIHIIVFDIFVSSLNMGPAQMFSIDP
jgi:hypothetical protein